MKKIVSIGIACGIVLGIIYIFMKQENKIVTNNIATPIIKPTQQTQEKKRKIYALGDSLTA